MVRPRDSGDGSLVGGPSAQEFSGGLKPFGAPGFPLAFGCWVHVSKKKDTVTRHCTTSRAHRFRTSAAGTVVQQPDRLSGTCGTLPKARAQGGTV